MAESTRYTLPPNETLAILNSHLGRFLAHTDELLQECQTFGDSVRSSLEAQIGKLDSTVAAAMAEAGQRAAARLDAQLERAVGDRLSALRQELEALVALSGQAAAPVPVPTGDAQRAPGPGPAGPEPVRARPGLGMIGLLLVMANLLLAALLVAGLIRNVHGSSAPARPATDQQRSTGEPGAIPPGPAGASWSTIGVLCEGLTSRPDADQARAFVAASAAAWCDGGAGAVTANLLQALSPASTNDMSAAPDEEPGSAAPAHKRKKS